MFPLSYRHIATIKSEHLSDLGDKEFLEIFQKQFDNPKILPPSTITFDNFNFFLKRHKWLDNGELKITIKDNVIQSELTLYFYTTPIIFLMMSIGIVALNTETILWACFGVTCFWLFFGLLYLWTSVMFNMTVRNTILRQLFNKENNLPNNNI